MGIAVKPLPPEKLFAVGVIEALNHTISPRLRYRNKHGLDPEMQTESNNQARWPGVAIAAMKAQFIIKLQEVRQPDRFPAAKQALGYWPVRLGPLWLDINPVAEKIVHIERVKLAIPFDVPWTDKVGLMDVIDVERFFKIRIFDTLGDITSFF